MLSGAAVFLWPLSAMTHVLSRSKRILLLTNPTVSLNSHVARCSHQVTPCVNHDHPKGHFIINDHPETARAEGQIVRRRNLFRIIVSKRVFYNVFLIGNHQVVHEILPGDAERPLRHLWLRACITIPFTSLETQLRCYLHNQRVHLLTHTT